MADITSRDLEQLIETLRDHTNTVSRNMTRQNNTLNNNQSSRNLDKANNEKVGKLKQLSKHLGDATDSVMQVDSSLEKLHKGTKETAALMGEFGRNWKSLIGTIGASVTGLGFVIRDIRQASETYRGVIEHGQAFGGSIVKMQKAAADAALPLNEFASVVKNNSKVMAAAGVKTFTDISKGVRSSLNDFGMLGMTTEQLNEHLGDYMETQRLYGMTSNMNTDRAANSMSKLTVETTKLSEMTGKSRMDISRQTNAAMRDMSMVSRMMLHSGMGLQNFGENADMAVRYMAAMPGQAGETLSRMLSQTIGKGSALLTDDLSTFIDGGAYGVVELMDTMRAKVESGTFSAQDSEDFKHRFLDEIGNNLESIKWQSDTGNEHAMKVLQIYSEMKAIKDRTPQEIAKQDALTKTMMGFEEITKRVTTYFRDHYYTVLGRFVDAVTAFTKTESFTKIKIQVDEFINGLSGFIDGFFVEENMNKLSSTVFAITEVLGATISGTLTVFGWLTAPIMLLQEKLGSLTAGVAALIGYFGGKFLIKMIFGKIISAVTGSITGVFDRVKEMTGMKSTGRTPMNPLGTLKKSPTGALRVWVDNNIGNVGRRAGRSGGGRGGRTTGGGNRSTTNRTNRTNRTTTSPARTKPVPTTRTRTPARTKPAPTTRTRTPVRRTPKMPSPSLGTATNFAKTATTAARGIGLGLLLNEVSERIDNAEDFTGKSTAQAGMAAANGALTGAAIGSFIPGIGTIVGGAVGGVIGGGMEIYDNWDNISKDLSDIGSKISGFFSSTDKKQADTVTQPTTPTQPPTPKVQAATIEEMQKKMQEIQTLSAKESSEMKETINKLLDMLAESSMTNTESIKTQLEELRKTNRHLSSIADQ